MTAPLGSISAYSRPTGPVVVPPPPRPVPPLEMAPSAPVTAPVLPLRVTPDHLSLIQALIDAGQTTRALDLLNAVWHPQFADEHSWYLRLRILVEEGRLLEALELTRVAAGRLPGSGAIAYLQAALEQAAGAPTALETALRAATLAPERPEPRSLVAALLAPAEDSRRGEPAALPGSASAAEAASPACEIPNPNAAALAGAALLHPLGSDQPYRPTVQPVALAPQEPPRARSSGARLGAIAAATVLAALWAVRHPVPASVALGLMVLWLARPTARPRSAAGS
jgi:hypothetical protein